MPTHAIQSLHAEMFGPFQDVDVEFSPELNVVVGDNATGKTQLLKLLYAATEVLTTQDNLAKGPLGTSLGAKLSGVFRPDSLGRLANRLQGQSHSEVTITYSGQASPLSFSFSTRSRTDVTVDRYPDSNIEDTPVFLPARELLSLYPGFASLYDTRELEFDETWRDTALLLGRPPLRGRRLTEASELLQPLLDLLEGNVVDWGGRFYVQQPGVGNIEATLLAEGHRKLAMLVRLVQSGVILEGGYLFWDEPEANLNPTSQRTVAQAISLLASHGAQVFVATHSLFLVRELQMIPNGASTRFIGLRRGYPGTDDSLENRSIGVFAESVDDPADLTSFAALTAESDQSWQYLDA